MKPFDLEKAKAGAKVITRNRLPVRILCFDLKHTEYSIVATVLDNNVFNTEHVILRRENGMKYTTPDAFDLFMAPTKKYGAMWISRITNKPTCSDRLYDSEEAAIACLSAVFDGPKYYQIVEFEV